MQGKQRTTKMRSQYWMLQPGHVKELAHDFKSNQDLENIFKSDNVTGQTWDTVLTWQFIRLVVSNSTMLRITAIRVEMRAME